MRAAGEARDARASRAKPRREARGCVRGRHATTVLPEHKGRAECARRTRRRPMSGAADKRLAVIARQLAEAAARRGARAAAPGMVYGW